ncbi:hypothetical protein [Sulfuricurvum sp.]|uniref:hypothetical protein n=1 Tax=Sulfuricurvum sp. TaxID=2025608 RepID=UPI00262655AE|nr:hypothetical protein [Sulfuricurvum sp.]MDD2266377.1 hypothetical protein [Sulfuricurvum sp.]MDD2782959.1 hypothetical protein [Sulfuricurvum sp.]
MREKSYTYSPDEPEKIDQLIIESYDQLVQLERRNLLLVSAIVFFSALTKINPTTGNILGITFQHLKEMHFYLGLVALVSYFLIAYLVYGYPKFKTTLKAKRDISKKAMLISRNVHWWEIEWWRFSLDFKYLSWLLFHYIFPLLAGITAIIIGLLKAV